MKKGILLFGIAGACLLLTGCGNKATLKCNMNSSGVDINFNIDFKGNSIDAMDLKYAMDLSDFSDSQIDILKNQDLCSGLKEDMDEFKDAFADCKQELNDKKLNISAKFNVDKISSEKRDKMQTPEDAKKDLESSGYKCTIEK